MKNRIFNKFLKNAKFEIRGSHEWCIYSNIYEFYFLFDDKKGFLNIDYLDNDLSLNQRLNLAGVICIFLDSAYQKKYAEKLESINAPDDLEHGVYGYGY